MFSERGRGRGGSRGEQGVHQRLRTGTLVRVEGKADRSRKEGYT